MGKRSKGYRARKDAKREKQFQRDLKEFEAGIKMLNNLKEFNDGQAGSPQRD